MTFLFLVVLPLTALFISVTVSHIRTSRRLSMSIGVNRVLYADWQSIPVYVADDNRLQCNLPDCPTEGFFDLPGRREPLRAIVVAISEHMRLHHPDEVAKWKAVRR